MKMRERVQSLRFQVVLIVLFSMSAMLIFQGISMGRFLSFNSRLRGEYIAAANESLAAALKTTGENIKSMAFFIASFESFKALYFPGRSAVLDAADMVSAAFQTVRFIANYYPIVLDVAVVGLNKTPFSYYMGYGYDFMELMGPLYDFNNPKALESRFFYFEGQDYFVYVTPISAAFSILGDTEKIASCVFICDLNHLRELARIGAGDEEVHFSIIDREGRLIAFGGEGPLPGENAGEGVEIVSPVENMGLTVIARAGPPGMILGRDRTARYTGTVLAFSIVLLVICTALVIGLLRLKIVRPIAALVRSMEAGALSPLHTRLERSRIEEIDQIVDGVNSLLDEIGEYTRRSMKAQRDLYEMELRKNEAEIYALQSQINPHFLNNTLQCIRSIAISRGVGEIADITLAMSELFRYAMNYEEYALVREELDIVRGYILITNIRFRNRFSFSFDVEERVSGCPVCRMILQPLVENAVRHGVSRREAGGLVEITGKLEGGIIRFEVIDDGPGFGEERLEEIRRELAYSFSENRELRKGGSFGLYNINRRLKLNYGEAYGLEILQAPGKTALRIRFPAG